MSTYNISSPGILGIETDAPDMTWSWGVNMPAATKAGYEQCRVKLRFTVDDDFEIPKAHGSNLGKYHYFSGAPGGDELFYSRTLVGRQELRLSVAGLLSGIPTVTVNRNYLRFIKHRFMNLHSAGYILTDIAAHALTRAGLAPVHCAAFSLDGMTVLILAPPNTGKTLTAMMACLENGADFIAEDFAVTDGRRLHSVPWTSTFRYYERVDSTRRSRLLNRATSVFPPLELAPLARADRVDTLIDANRIVSDKAIDAVVVLERGAESVIPGEIGEMAQKAINLNRYEFNYIKAPALVAYEFFNPELDLSKAQRFEHEVLTRVLADAPHKLVVTSPNATRYAKLIIDYIRPFAGPGDSGGS